MTVLNAFSPLLGAIAHAESWTSYLDTHRDELADRRPEEIAASLESFISAGVCLGRSLPITWRLTFDNLFRPGKSVWTTPQEFESIRQEVRRLFFTAREALERFREVGELLQRITGRKSAMMNELCEAIEDARRLEENVFRDWPSFVDPIPPSTGSLPVDESLAEILGISVEEARQKMDARRRELNTKPE